jgi:uncharacterized protein YeaO (DUF488 family)
MPILTKRIYEAPAPEDGFRLLVMRYWPRGIAKTRVAAWEPALAPSRRLLASYRSGSMAWEAYAQGYVAEMNRTAAAQAALSQLRQRASTETVTLLCSCTDEALCHRSLLRGLVDAHPA